MDITKHLALKYSSDKQKRARVVNSQHINTPRDQDCASPPPHQCSAPIETPKRARDSGKNYSDCNGYILGDSIPPPFLFLFFKLYRILK